MRTIYLLALCVIALSRRSSAQDLPKMLESELPLPLLAAATPTTTPGQAQGNSTAPVASAADAAPPSSSLLPDPAAAGNAQPTASLSQNVTINLINRLVQRGALTQSDAVDLIRLAEQDAVIAQNQAQVLVETKVALEQAAPPPPADEDEYRVTYIPDTVKDQIREDLRQDVMSQAKREGWAAPNAFPEWTSRIKLFGDIRMRYDSFGYSAGNDTSGVFPNFNAINTGVPYDVSNTTVDAARLNADQDRERTRLRMRLGFDVDMEDGFTAGIRMATGGNSSPVSTNQTLGSANSAGTGGNFSKYELWLDRAFIKYENKMHSNANLTMLLGRFDNPYMTSSQIMWDEDVGLDGISFKIVSPWKSSFKTFFTAGAFPVFNSDANYAATSSKKTASHDKYLIAAQLGTEIKISKKIDLKSSIAIYDWQNLEGELSDPYIPLSNSDAGSTDDSRPLFAQKGNTYRAIRNITPSPLNGNGTTNQYQYFGLASKFRQIAWSGRLDFNHYEPMQVSLLGEFIKNLAFDNEEIDSFAVNNRGGGGVAGFEGGDTAYYAGVNVGKAIPAFDKRGDWSVGLGYRHVESDAVIDGFTDSVFGGGGTNMEGYTLNAAMAISKRAWFRVAYMSATQIAGPQLKSDVFLIDFATKF